MPLNFPDDWGVKKGWTAKEPPEQKIRVWWKRLDPMEPMLYFPAKSLNEAKKILKKLIDKDLANPLVLSNTGGCEVLTDGVWEEYNDEDGFTMVEIITGDY